MRLWPPGERLDTTTHSRTVRKAKEEMDGCRVRESAVCARMCEEPLEPCVRNDPVTGCHLSCDNSLSCDVEWGRRGGT